MIGITNPILGNANSYVENINSVNGNDDSKGGNDDSVDGIGVPGLINVENALIIAEYEGTFPVYEGKTAKMRHPPRKSPGNWLAA